jgi:polysaccharide biosynthesis/export protein
VKLAVLHAFGWSKSYGVSACFLLGLGALHLSCAGACPTIPPAEKSAFLGVRPEEGGYAIQPADQLQIEVWQNKQLTRTVTVRPDGKFTLPLVNEVTAGGMTVPNLQKQLTDQLASFVREPLVNITVISFGRKQIYVQGQVRTPAAYNYAGDMFLLQALTLAGGPTPFSEGCAVVVRRSGDGFLRYDVPLDPIMSGEQLKENISLHPNDVVTVH